MTYENTPIAGDSDEYTFSVDQPTLGDYDELIRDRGLDPSEWVVQSCTLNEWDSALAGGGTQRLQQWKIVLRRAARIVLVTPAPHIPAVRQKRCKRPQNKPQLFVVAADQHTPMHDQQLHELFLESLSYFRKKHNLTDLCLLGDTMDLPTVSRHPDSPAAMQSVQECIDSAYRLLRDYRETAPDTRCRLLLGNHDIRIQTTLLQRAERLYGIRCAEEDVDALSLRNLLHLDRLGIELVEGMSWEQAELEIIPDKLIARHGWILSQRSALKSVQKRGLSVVFGHLHRRDHVYYWNPTSNEEQQGVCIGAMCQTRSGEYPSYTDGLEGWTQGFATISVFPDQSFTVDHGIYEDGTLRWRDQQW